jgi:dCTP diphosphatase
MNKLKNLQKMIIDFANERDWNQFHSPKNLAMALSTEAAELLELFLWVKEEDSYNLDIKKLDRLKEEIGDIMIYLINLSNKYNINPIDAAIRKIEINAKKYPVEKVKGKSKKYNEY